MKRIKNQHVLWLLILLTVFMAITMTAYAKELDPAAEAMLNEYNKDMRDYYGFTEDIFTESNVDKEDLSISDVLGNNIICYGDPHGDIDKNTGLKRYLGYTIYGDDYVNPWYKLDRSTGKADWTFTDVYNDYLATEDKIGKLTQKGWIYRPWEDGDLKGVIVAGEDGLEATVDKLNDKFNMVVTSDSEIQRLLNESIKLGIRETVKGGRFFIGDEEQFEKIPNWTDFVHIIQPPSYTVDGVGRMWHREEIKLETKLETKLWYIAIPLVAFRDLSIEPDFGDLNLSEKRITQAFNLSNLGSLRTFNFSYGSAGSHYHSNWVDTDGDGILDTDKGSNKNRSAAVDNKYNYIISNSNTLNSTAIATLGQFIPKWNSTNTLSGTASWNGGSNSLSPNLFFAAWRGKDLPTLASYKESASHPLLALGLKIGKTPQTTRNTVGGYTDNLLVELVKSASGDYETTFTCGDSPRTQTHNTSDSAKYEASLAVHSYIGKANVANSTINFKTSSFKVDGITFNKATGTAIPNNHLIKFYPYVQMAYDLPSSRPDGAGVSTQAVNVLSAHESSIKPIDYVDIGWFNSGSQSLNLNSTQWSTHAKAAKAWGKDNVLPGGAIYTLDTKTTQTKVAVSTWQHYIPTDQLSNVTDGASYYTSDLAVNRDKALNDSIKKSLDTLDIVQWIDKDASKANAFGGIALNGLGGQSVYGQTTSKDNKYLLKRNTAQSSTYANEADLDIVGTPSVIKTYYKVSANTAGTITVYKSTNGSTWTALASIGKTEGVTAITNAEAKELDNRTKLITNFILALDRNQGNDTSISDPKWYNEAWDGLAVVKIDTVYTIGLKNPAVRSVALDPKLTPAKASKSDLYSKAYISQFRVDNKPSIATFNGVDITIPEVYNMYVSKKFYIPNATVMDLY